MDKIKKVKRRNISFFVSENESPNIPGFWDDATWESHTYEVLEKFLDKQHSYIDVGVHLGQTVLYGSQLAKTCYAVEPDPECIRIIRKNIELNNQSNINLIQKALGKDCDSIRLSCPDNLLLGSSATTHFNSDQSAKSFEVQSISLPTLVNSENVNDLSFIKIDVEGMEDVIIDNIGDIAVPILIEIHTPLLYYKSQGFDKIINYLKQYNKIYFFFGGRKFPIKADDLSKLYVEENSSKGYFSVLGCY